MVDTLIQEKVLRQIDEHEVVAFTQEMVRFESQNGNEGPIARWLADRLAQAGMEVQLTDVHRGRLNVVGVLPGREAGIGLLFHGHTDTVPFLNMKDPLSGEVADGCIWGRGACDQKGGLAASIMAVQAIARAGVPLRKGVAVAAVVDEESEHRGSYALVEQGIQADGAIVTEPSGLRLVLACKGTAPIRITFHGRIAHGATPWLGVNAIEKAAKAVLALGELPLRTADLPGLGSMRGSINVGLIRGGTAYNNVAHECSIFLDRRTVPGETQSTCLAEIRQLLDRLAAEDPQFRATLEVDRPDWEWEPIKRRGLNPAVTPPDAAVAQALMRAHRAVVGEPVALGYTDGYLDMDFLVNDLGIPTANYGPGDLALAHTDQERLDVGELLTATRVYALAALEMCL
ncbi:MAG TPA: M20 family metallopeptidase [Thermoflexia bacterium]|nr:M20 family metallopeptidase [Thermoflexia bacterium]